MSHSAPRVRFWLFFLLLTILVAAFLLRPPGTYKVQTGIKKTLESAPLAPVLVVFKVPHSGEFHSLPLAERRDLVQAGTDSVIHRAGQRARVVHRFNYVRAVAMKLDRAAVNRFRHDPDIAWLAHDQVERVVPREDKLSHADATPRVTGIPIWNKADHFKVKLAVIDSGVEAGHPDLQDALIGEACFCSAGPGCCPSGEPRQFGPGAARDDAGHGTAVAGLALGRGHVSPPGPAMDAGLIAVRVVEEDVDLCCYSDIIAAFDWIAANQPDTRVINSSLALGSGASDTCGNRGFSMSALADAVSAVQANGALVVAAGGNMAGTSEIAAPACLPGVVSVGAVYADDYDGMVGGERECKAESPRRHQLTCFSNRSPDLDIMAPGAMLTGAALGGGLRTEDLSGTSFSTPQVAGCAARLAGIYPELSMPQVMELILESAGEVTSPDGTVSWPLLDCDNAVH